jgi:ribosome-interacting GTPase 1
MKRQETYEQMKSRIRRVESKRGAAAYRAWLRRQIAALRQKLKALK